MKKMLYRVDLNNDFMKMGGALYVPGAEAIINNIVKLNSLEWNFLTGSVDAHSVDDAEFKIFPLHCVKGTFGQEEISELGSKALYVEQDVNYDLNELLKSRELIFEKNATDIGVNENARRFFEEFGGLDVYLCGVVTNICVLDASRRLHEWGARVKIVADAVRGLYDIPGRPDPEEALRVMIKDYRATLISTDDAVNSF